MLEKSVRYRSTWVEGDLQLRHEVEKSDNLCTHFFTISDKEPDFNGRLAIVLSREQAQKMCNVLTEMLAQEDPK